MDLKNRRTRKKNKNHYRQSTSNYSKEKNIFEFYCHALKNVLLDCPQEAFIPIVVFTGDAKLKISAPTSTVIDIKDLRNTIENYNEPIFSEKEKVNIYKRLIEVADDANKKNLRKEHIRQVRSKKSQG